MATDQSSAESTGSAFARPVERMERLSEEAYAYLLLIPTFLILALVAFYPMLETLRFSMLADETRTADPFGEFVGLDNYVAVLTGEARIPRQVLDVSTTGSFPFLELGSPFMRQALFVTLAFALLSVFFETLIGFGQALVIDQEFRGRRWVRVAIIIPWAIPIIIQGMIFFLLFNPTVGFGADFMQWLGAFGSNPMSSSRDAFVIVLVADIWKTSAFMALLILAGLQSVDRSLYDVAKVSGATPWQRFKYVTLPLVLPALLVAMLFRTMDAMRIYGLIDATVGCSTVPSMTCMVISSFDKTRRWATAATVAFLIAVLIGLLVSVYLLKLRDARRGVV